MIFSTNVQYIWYSIIFFFSENSQTLPNIKNEIGTYFEWQEIKIKILKFDVY